MASPLLAPEPLLSVSGLTTAFRRGRVWTPVIRDISLAIAPGETLAVVGESGSGKSVTALSVMKLLPAGSGRIEAGSIRFEGEDLTHLGPQQMARLRGNRISMIFQEPMTSLNPTMTVAKQIGEVLRLHRNKGAAEARREVLALLDRVRIPSAAKRLDDYPHQFSGGMRQRVMIAMALACKPRLLIADEPTTALDVTVQAQILTLIKELQAENGMSVMFITHDMGVVAEVADRALVMRRGAVIESGRCSDLFAYAQQPYTRSLLMAVPRLSASGGASLPQRLPELDETGADIAPSEPIRDTVDRSASLLSVKNLTTRFDVRAGLLRRVVGRVHAVENLSFDLHKGETLSLVGESGCGKSTTGRSLMGLIAPRGGKVRLDGVDLLTCSKADLMRMRRRVQMIFQDPYASLNPRQRVGDAIAEPLIVHGLATQAEANKAAQSLLDQMGLPADSFGRYPHEFSGGQRQRICIARVLGLKPEIIVADEAVSALDVSVKAQIINLMLKLQQDHGLSYLFISHDMAVVEKVSHRVAVMYLGEIVEIGPKASIFGKPQHSYTQRLLAAVPVPDPSRRHNTAPLASSDLPSPYRGREYQPPKRLYREVAPGHLVMAE